MYISMLLLLLIYKQTEVKQSKIKTQDKILYIAVKRIIIETLEYCNWYQNTKYHNL